jgi:molecular chaperone GrpE (heat shock protein)
MKRSSDSRTTATPQNSMSEDESSEEQAEEPVPEEEEIELTLEEQLAEAIARAEKAEAEITYREADIANLRRRTATDKAELLKFAGFNLANRILPVLDSLDKALEVAEDGPMSDGVRLTRENLLQALQAEGLTQIQVGPEFDPKTMEAITTLPASDEHQDGSVIDTLESGWMYKDRVLRPARVVVAKE